MLSTPAFGSTIAQCPNMRLSIGGVKNDFDIRVPWIGTDPVHRLGNGLKLDVPGDIDRHGTVRACRDQVGGSPGKHFLSRAEADRTLDARRSIRRSIREYGTTFRAKRTKEPRNGLEHADEQPGRDDQPDRYSRRFSSRKTDPRGVGLTAVIPTRHQRPCSVCIERKVGEDARGLALPRHGYGPDYIRVLLEYPGNVHRIRQRKQTAYVVDHLRGVVATEALQPNLPMVLPRDEATIQKEVGSKLVGLATS